MKLSLSSSITSLQACGLALLLALAPSVWAQCVYFDAFKDNDDGTVTDPRSGTVWQRCAVGQSWNGVSCTGDGRKLAWWDAMRAAKEDKYLGKTDWRLPTKNELLAVVGKFNDCVNAHPRRAVSIFFQGELEWNWSSSTDAGFADKAGLVNFRGGAIASDNRSVNHYQAQLVRADRQSTYLEFNREFAKIGQYERVTPGQKHQRTNLPVSRTGSYGYVHGPNCSGDMCNYNVTCSEGGLAMVAVHKRDSNIKNIHYYNGGYTSDSGQYSTESALQLACRGR